MSETIELPGLRAESLLGFLAALGTLRTLTSEIPNAKLGWKPSGCAWIAVLHLPSSALSSADDVAKTVHSLMEKSAPEHPILSWSRFLGKSFTNEERFFQTWARAYLSGSEGADFSAVFTSQQPYKQGDILEHFDHPFRAARKDYYLGNLKSVLENTELLHIVRTIVRPWDYRDAMANQSLRLDHGDDRRHAYQWHAPTEDPARHKVGCMLGANRLAIEAFPLFPCIPAAPASTAVGFDCSSKTFTWITWPIWQSPCLLNVISSLLNLSAIHEPKPELSKLNKMGVIAVMRSRRLPVEKNKVFLPAESVAR